MNKLVVCAAPANASAPPCPGWQPIAWDPVRFLQAQALQEPEDLVLRATCAKTIAKALVPGQPDCAGDEIWTTLARGHAANVLLMAVDLDWDIAECTSWLDSTPSARLADASFPTEELSPAGIGPARQVAGILWHPDGKIIDSITVTLRESAVPALQHACNCAGLPGLTPDHAAKTAVTLETAATDEGPAALYLAAARRHLAALGVTANDLQLEPG